MIRKQLDPGTRLWGFPFSSSANLQTPGSGQLINFKNPKTYSQPLKTDSLAVPKPAYVGFMLHTQRSEVWVVSHSPPSSCVTSGKPPNLSVPQPPRLQSEDDDSSWGCGADLANVSVRHSEQCPFYVTAQAGTALWVGWVASRKAEGHWFHFQ